MIRELAGVAPFFPASAEARSNTRLWLYVLLAFLLLTLLVPSGTIAGGEGDQPSNDVAQLEAIQRQFQHVVERVAPSVVGIRAKRRYVLGVPGAEIAASAGGDQLVIVNGSGTVIRGDGSILTNEHVIQSATEIEVTCFDGRSLPAMIVAADPRSDLAVLRVVRQDLPPVTWCDWSQVARGQWALTLGNPYGLSHDGSLSVSVGVVSNLGRRLPGLGEVDDRLYHDMIQTTAAISPGNSGGPLFNIRGELIGVVTAMHTRAAAEDGVGFAIPLTDAKRRLIERLLDARPVEYGYLGVTVRGAEPRGANRASAGAVVEAVEPNGPAARADVRVEDVIVRLNDGEVQSPAHLAELLAETPPGRHVRLAMRRGDQSLQVDVPVERRQVNRVEWLRSGAIVWRGMRLANLTPESRSRMKVDSAAVGVVVIDVMDDGFAARAHIEIGDVIERVGDGAIRDIVEFRSRVSAEKGAVTLTVRNRGDRTILP